MKKQILVASLSLLTAISFGQKKEIKKAQKAVSSNNYSEAFSYLDQAEALLGDADNDLKASFYATKGNAYSGSAGESNLEKMKMAVEAYLKAIELDASVKKNNAADIEALKAKLVNSALKDQEAKRYDVAGERLATAYQLSKTDTSYLYFAASNAVTSNDYDTALEYYKKLLDLGYTGIEKQYVGIDKETGEEKFYNDKNTLNLMVKTGEIIKPTERMSESRVGEILRNITLIYIEKGQPEKAKSFIAKARKENPNDVALMRADASMQKEMGNIDRYNEIMKEIIAADPDNPNTYFTLADAASEEGDYKKATEYYKKALELAPDSAAAMINIGVMMLKKEEDIVTEMNNLGSTRADDERYEVLKAEREQIYKDVLPYFEKASKIESEADNIGLLKTLMSIYSQLGEDAKYKEIKALVAQKEG